MESNSEGSNGKVQIGKIQMRKSKWKAPNEKIKIRRSRTYYCPHLPQTSDLADLFDFAVAFVLRRTTSLFFFFPTAFFLPAAGVLLSAFFLCVVSFIRAISTRSRWTIKTDNGDRWRSGWTMAIDDRSAYNERGQFYGLLETTGGQTMVSNDDLKRWIQVVVAIERVTFEVCGRMEARCLVVWRRMACTRAVFGYLVRMMKLGSKTIRVSKLYKTRN